MSHLKTINMADDTLLRIADGESVAGTKTGKRVLDYLRTRGLITITPETTPIIRVTDLGRSRAEAHRRTK